VRIAIPKHAGYLSKRKATVQAVRALVHIASATRTWKATVVKEDPSQDQSDRQDAEDVDRGELERCGAHDPGREPDTPSNPMTTAMLDPRGEVRVWGNLAVRHVHILSLCNENRIVGKDPTLIVPTVSGTVVS
jgi:hypothetical protein